VTGAMEGASSVGQAAVTAVRDVLVATVSGLKEVASAILPGGEGASPAPPGAASEKKAPKTH
jgi:hypothetical protein